MRTTADNVQRQQTKRCDVNEPATDDWRHTTTDAAAAADDDDDDDDDALCHSR